eukprot:TRINITY_DN32122_c0_g1_i1.p1 TRINITY_DN32122_c0_g1~~TRINITY_DN32122_c0_g1_i1.p1  ORF type:complete len:325 (-),score=100.86 TRINITY_DN32122_c0_g1_i1:417-1391(-)
MQACLSPCTNSDDRKPVSRPTHCCACAADGDIPEVTPVQQVLKDMHDPISEKLLKSGAYQPLWQQQAEDDEADAQRRLEELVAKKQAEEDRRAREAEEAAAAAAALATAAKEAEVAAKEKEAAAKAAAKASDKKKSSSPKTASKKAEATAVKKEKDQDAAVIVEDEAEVDAKMQTRFEFEVKVVGARGLRSSDWSPGTAQPYCLCQTIGKNKQKCRTRTASDKEKPNWNQKVKLTLNYKDSVKITVMDQDAGKPDTKLGFVEIPFDDLCSKGIQGELKLAECTEGCEGYVNLNVKLLRSYPNEGSEVLERSMENSEAAMSGEVQ